MRAVLRSAALRVVVLAMILRALVPQGWMLDAQASAHGAALMPCPGVTQADMPASAMPDDAHDTDAMAASPAAHDMAHMAMHDMSTMPGMSAMHHHEMAPAHHAPTHKAESGTLCVFAAAAQLGSPAPDIAALPPTPASVAIAFAARHDAPARTSVHRPNAARAPPLPA